MLVRSQTALICGVLLLTGAAKAGTVINLGPTSAIINISGTEDGARAYNSDQSMWYQPFNVNGNLLEYTVQAGTYTFALVNNDPDSAFYNPNAAYTAWTFNSPWLTNYLVFDVSAATNPNEAQLLYLAHSTTAGSNASDAFNLAVEGGYRTATYTFNAPETLIFAVPDYALGDNAGGVSVLLSQSSNSATPEPASPALIGLGLTALLFRFVRHRQKQTK